MQLVHVQVTGFGRIRDSSFSADRKLTAILGPNEAGKTSLLRALLSLNDEGPIAESMRNRSAQMRDADVIVKVEYALSETDLQPFTDRPWSELPRRLIVKKLADGTLVRTFDKEPEHLERTWKTANSAIAAVLRNVGAELDPADDLSPEALAARAEIKEFVERLNRELSDRYVTVTQDEVSELRSALAADSDLIWFDLSLVEQLLESIVPLVAEPLPARAVMRHLESLRPRFELFSEDDRRLRHEYEFSDLENGEHPALKNLLSLAGVDLAEILPNPARRTAVATARDKAAETLEHVFVNAWRQHRIAVKIDFEPDRLILLVKDATPSGQTIAFDERSDGLRTFVALTAFLSARAGDVAPILLIDEAEARLHWDAQADLVSVLQTSTEVGQILYTTHSPGCLPPDLGTGVIFVQPDPIDPNVSAIRRDFWTLQSDRAFGATPILFLMGAGAAAYSRVRRAVVTEGPSDMLLLPTIFRAATKQAELDFQIVPGISVTAKERLSTLDDVGVHVVYLVDGDNQGVEWAKQLKTDASVDPERIKSLPPGLAVEDLIEQEYYVRIFLDLVGRNETFAQLDLRPGVLKPQLESLCRTSWGVEPPGAIDVAEAILSKLDADHPGVPDHHRLPLASGAPQSLKLLYKELVSALDLG